VSTEVKYDNGVATVKHRGRMTMINLQVTAEGILDGYPIRPTKVEQIAFAAAHLKLQAELEQAKADTERLDWILSNRMYRVKGSDLHGWAVLDCSDGLEYLTEKHATSRDAIDAAIQSNRKR